MKQEISSEHFYLIHSAYTATELKLMGGFILFCLVMLYLLATLDWWSKR